MKDLRDAKTRLELDVAERVKKLREEIAMLRDASVLKDEFIRVTNHELRTPLDIIRGNLDMVLKGESGRISLLTQEYLTDVLMGADRLTKLVNDMLDISRIESDRIKFKLEEVDLKEIFNTIKNEFTQTFHQKSIDFIIDYPQDVFLIFSDRARIFQILDNFLGNSLKFTPAKGRVTLGARNEKDTVVLLVHDTGIGIRPEDQYKIFKRFPRIDSNMPDAPVGTGLGLNLVYQLSEKLGGDTWMESTGIGMGTTFFIRLPCAGSKRADALKRFHERFLQEGI